MKKFVHLLLIAAFIALFASCKSGENSTSTANKNSAAESSIAFQERFFDAQSAKAKGDFKKAYPLFQDCLQFKNDPSVHYEIARIERQQLKSPESALNHIKAAVLVDKNNPWYQHELGACYMDLGKYDLASKAFKEMSRINPTDPNARYEQAGALLLANKTQEAIAVYDELEKTQGPYEELSFQKHELYMKLKQYEKAGLELEKLALAYPEEPRYWGYAAQFYQQGGQEQKMLYALEQMKKADPNNGQVHFQLSQYYATKGDDAKSYEELRLAFETQDLSIDEKINVLLKYYRLIQMQSSYLTQAHELLEITQRLHSTDAKIYSMYGDFLVYENRIDEAVAKYKKALEFDQSRVQIWDQIARLEGALERFADMQETCNKALELFPNQPEFYLFRGMSKARQGNHLLATEDLEYGKELVVDNKALLVEFYSNLGSAYNSLKNYPKSDESFDQCIAIDPENALVLNNYAYYLALRKTKLDKALAMAKKCNEIQPNEISFQDTYAWVLFQSGNLQEALTWMEKVINSGKAGADEYEHYGDILMSANRKTEALNNWRIARDKGSKSTTLSEKISTQRYIE